MVGAPGGRSEGGAPRLCRMTSPASWKSTSTALRSSLSPADGRAAAWGARRSSDRAEAGARGRRAALAREDVEPRSLARLIDRSIDRAREGGAAARTRERDDAVLRGVDEIVQVPELDRARESRHGGRRRPPGALEKCAISRTTGRDRRVTRLARGAPLLIKNRLTAPTTHQTRATRTLASSRGFTTGRYRCAFIARRVRGVVLRCRRYYQQPTEPAASSSSSSRTPAASKKCNEKFRSRRPAPPRLSRVRLTALSRRSTTPRAP